MKNKKQKIPEKRNPMARDLANRKYRARVVPAKKGKGSFYNRNKIKVISPSNYDGLLFCQNTFTYQTSYSENLLH